MRILLVNYHYFMHGGPDRYFFNVKDALEREGHTVVPFAFDYEETLGTPYRRYFPEPITGKGPCLLSKLSLSTSAKAKAAFRMFHNREVNGKFRQVILDERPDVVFSIYLSSTFLPNILQIAKEEFGLPVLYRLSDFHMFCASYLFTRDCRVCTDCMGKRWSALKHSCVHGSVLASALRVLQIEFFRHHRCYDCVDVFLCPSKLMADYLVKQGVPSSRVTYLPTFARDLTENRMCKNGEPPYVLYFGRITREKGAEVVIKAFNRIKAPAFRLKMVGYVEPSFEQALLACLDDKHNGLVEILPAQQGEDLTRTIRQALFVVHPALWLENTPNSLLEAMAAGKAVVASNLGSLPELVQDKVNGRLFEAGNTEALADIMNTLVLSPDLTHKMGTASRSLYEQNYTEAIHMQRLRDILLRCVHKQS